MCSLNTHVPPSTFVARGFLVVTFFWVAQSQPYAAVYRLPPPPTTSAKPKPPATTKPPADVIVNLSNFVLLGVLKFLVHVLGIFGFTLGIGTTGKRSAENDEVSEAVRDAAWAATMMFGGPAETDCIRHLACLDPDRGKRQLDKALVIGNYIQPWHEFLPVEAHYRVLKKIELSVKDGILGKKCLLATCPRNFEILK